ncbi:unnamed protein product, partial [Mesorhabditis belari]|uniref:MARVEL domain-containing protein n=1 Tax=Mesorhabditis belari TaxID=2138241 RepID=A0AAF3EZW5_9BILA
MAFGDLKQLPHLLKPLTLGLAILLFIFVLVSHAAWYPVLITCILLVFTLAMMLCFSFDVTFVQSPMWPKVEMVYSLVWTILSLLGGLLMFIQAFNHDPFGAVICVGLFAFQAIVWAFNAFQMWRGAPMTGGDVGGNQATAQPPFPGTGVNPGV